MNYVADKDHEERLRNLERELETVKAQLANVTSKLNARTHHLGVDNNIFPDLRSILARFVPHHRRDHPTRQELCFAARWAHLTYYTCSSSGANHDGLSVDTWNTLRLIQEPDQLCAAVHKAVEQCPNAIGYEASIERVVDSVREYGRQVVMVAHEESSPEALDGQVSIWRSDEQQLVIVAWRGTDSLVDAKLDAKSAVSTPFATKESKMHDRTKRRMSLDDDSISPLPHFHDTLMRHRLLVGKGFLLQYLGERLNERVKAHVADELRDHPDFGVLVTGHSLGGALSTLCTYEIAKLHLQTQVLNVSFGAPRHINREFTRVLAHMPNVRCYRVQNELDVVTRSRLNPRFKHLGRTIWLHRKRVSPPKPYGHVPLRLRFGGLDILPLCLPELFCCITSGVGDHQMDLYVDHMDGPTSSYRWDKYERRTRKERPSMQEPDLHEASQRRASRLEMTLEEDVELASAGTASGPVGPRLSGQWRRSQARSSTADKHLEAITQRLSLHADAKAAPPAAAAGEPTFYSRA